MDLCVRRLSRCCQLTCHSPTTPLINPVGIQMLPSELHEAIFGNKPVEPTQQQIDKAVSELERHDLMKQSTVQTPAAELPSVKFPPLHGSLSNHFRHIAAEQTAPYRRLVEELLAGELPARPPVWSRTPGWTRYQSDGATRAVDIPDADAFVFDVEVVVRAGVVVMATAVSSDAWFGWVSPLLTGGECVPGLSQLVPADGGSQRPRLIVGHNVGFDRSWIREQYMLEPTGTRFLDTMAMHIAVAGISSSQRAMKLKERSQSTGEVFTAPTTKKQVKRTSHPPMEWFSQSSLNSLADVYQLYCDGVLSKDVRNIFVTGDVATVAENFDELMSYCASDVEATWRVLRQLWPLFVERFPHPVTLAGTLEMGQTYLPVSDHWNTYIHSCEQTYDDLQNELRMALCRVANSACRFAVQEAYRHDPWLWNLDWSVKKFKLKKPATARAGAKRDVGESGGVLVDPVPGDWCMEPTDLTDEQLASDTLPITDSLESAFSRLWASSKRLYKVQPTLPGYPGWYTEMCLANDCLLDQLSASKRCVPKLLRLTWDGYPLHHDSRFGWGYLVPGRPAHDLDNNAFPLEALLKLLSPDKLMFSRPAAIESDECTDDSSEVTSDQPSLPVHMGSTAIEDVRVRGCWFFPLPHKDGEGNNVGNPLSKHFLEHVESGTMAAAGGASAERVLRITQSVSYWRNSRARITAQRPVFLTGEDLPPCMSEGSEGPVRLGAIVPPVCVSGTLTRRSVERTWLTASNVRSDRLGSELRAMVHAPPGYRIVGADVDSQELWIAALLGDSAWAQVHGGTALSWMTLQGSRAAGTDLHSRTASVAGVSRAVAKVLNYGRIYGGARTFATQLLRRSGGAARLSDRELRQRVGLMYRSTKGERAWRLSRCGLDALELVQTAAASTEQAGNDRLLAELLNARPEEPVTTAAASLLARLTGRRSHWRQLVVAGKCVWRGGTESHTFNALETIANSLHPATPVLQARMSRGIEPATVGSEFATSRVNWVVQSSAVDFLHVMLVCMRWLVDSVGLRARLALSVHDEVRYLVRREDADRLALALHVTNLLTRCLFAERVNMPGLPLSVAFFSAVDIDRTLRKDVQDDCVTPSNCDGLQCGYNIPPGESLDIHQLIKRVGSILSPETGVTSPESEPRHRKRESHHRKPKSLHLKSELRLLESKSATQV